MCQADVFKGAHISDIQKDGKLRSDPIVKDFMKSMCSAYVRTAEYLQQKLLHNEAVRELSALDPVARGHDLTVKLLKKLADTLPVNFTTEGK